MTGDGQTKRSQRSRKLIADFVGGFAHGWAFAVGKHYRDALDIKLTPRATEEGEQEEVWTQGDCYSFRAGDVLYDTPQAYQGTWQDALQHIRVAVQVVQAAPDTVDDNRQVPGYVTFAVLRPDATRARIVPGKTYTVSQAEFVALLQTGCLQGKSLE